MPHDIIINIRLFYMKNLTPQHVFSGLRMSVPRPDRLETIRASEKSPVFSKTAMFFLEKYLFSVIHTFQD